MTVLNRVPPAHDVLAQHQLVQERLDFLQPLLVVGDDLVRLRHKLLSDFLNISQPPVVGRKLIHLLLIHVVRMHGRLQQEFPKARVRQIRRATKWGTRDRKACRALRPPRVVVILHVGAERRRTRAERAGALTGTAPQTPRSCASSGTPKYSSARRRAEDIAT